MIFICLLLLELGLIVDKLGSNKFNARSPTLLIISGDMGEPFGVARSLEKFAYGVPFGKTGLD